MASPRHKRTWWILVIGALSGCEAISGFDGYVVGEAEGGSSACAPAGQAASCGACRGLQHPDGRGGCSDATCSVVCDDRWCEPDPKGNIGCGAPPSYLSNCDVSCGATGCADAGRVVCPNSADASCTVSCAGPGACFGTIIECGDGPCEVSCGPGACDEDTQVVCGAGPCTISCASEPTVVAGDTCALDATGCPSL